MNIGSVKFSVFCPSLTTLQLSISISAFISIHTNGGRGI